jgi:hypothetical protein
MITKAQRANAERIYELDAVFGHLPYNAGGQIIRETLNLSIPCAVLIHHEVVTGVKDSFDGVNDQAVSDVERVCRQAVELATELHGQGWWNEQAGQLLP